ncbi:hypothetical protein B566_EDAN011748 [Ephemera danica]|nr:hypothetical protein B566_EDAN011748 [Ephemera danica]
MIVLIVADAGTLTMLLTCKCLNVSITINGTGIQPIDLLQLGFSKETLCDEFFKNGAGTVELVEISKEQPSLVYIRCAGDWLVHRCLLCNSLTHAIHRERRPADVLVTYTLLSDPEQIAALKSSDGYSDVFRVVTNHHDYALTADDAVKPTGSLHMGALALQQALAEALRTKTSQVEERVRAYTEQQFAELEQFRTSAHEDHQSLLR